MTQRRAIALIWFLVALIPAALAGLGVLEGVLVLAGQPLITDHVRSWVGVYPLWGIGLGLAFLVVTVAGVMHFLVDR